MTPPSALHFTLDQPLMANLPSFRTFVLLALSTLPLAAPAAEKKAEADAGQWVRIPSDFTLQRVVQSASGPMRTYRVVIIVPRGGQGARVGKTCGRSAIDAVAFDYAGEMARKNAALREMNKTKELAFQLIVSPPALDASNRNEDGQKPIPAGKEFSTPMPEQLLYRRGMQDNGLEGEFLVTFGPQGGYPVEVMVAKSTGDPGTDLFYLRHFLCNWQTSKKTPRGIEYRIPIGVKRRGFGGHISL